MTPEEFCDHYRDGLTASSITEGHEWEMVGQARTALVCKKITWFLDNIKCAPYYLDINSLPWVFLTQRLGAFHKIEDQLCIVDANEQKRNHIRNLEAELDPHGNSNPCAPYHTPAGESPGSWNEGYGDNFNGSNVALPLQVVSTGNASAPFQWPDLYKDELLDTVTRGED